MWAHPAVVRLREACFYKRYGSRTSTPACARPFRGSRGNTPRMWTGNGWSAMRNCTTFRIALVSFWNWRGRGPRPRRGGRSDSGGAGTEPMARAKSELEAARLLAEATFCWDSMPEATRRWMRQNRSPEASHWKVVARLRAEDLVHAE